MFGGKSDVKFSGAYQQQMGCMFHKLLEFCAYILLEKLLICIGVIGMCYL